MTTFKTQAEIWQALLDGKKVKYKVWIPSAYIHFVDGRLECEEGKIVSESFSIPLLYELCEEPKPEPLNITEEDVGKRVRLRNGDIRLITGFGYNGYVRVVILTDKTYATNGMWDVSRHSEHDIVEILD